MDNDKDLLRVQRAQARAWNALHNRQMKALQIALAAKEEMQRLEAAMTAILPKRAMDEGASS
jgi:hypothetical protein